MEYLEVAIVGAGMYGLTAAKTYLKLEPQTNLAIFEIGDSPGGVWSKERIYPNLVAQVEHGYFHYPGVPMPREGSTSHNLVTGEMISAYLEKYMKDHGLEAYIRFKSWVETIERSPVGWRLKVNGRTIEARKLMICSGVTSIGNEPPFKVDADSMPVIHAKDIASHAPIMSSGAVRSIVVVGAAKSAYDAVYTLCSLGKRVIWAIRPDGSGPMPIIPPEIMGVNTITLSSTRLMSYLSPSFLNTKSYIGAFFHRTWLGRWITNAHWSYLTHLSETEAGFGGKVGKVEALKPDISERSCFWTDSSIGLITLDNFWSTLKAADLQVVRDVVVSSSRDSITLRSGQTMPADYVINCTGWGDHYKFFTNELKDELGLPIDNNCNSSSKSAAFWKQKDEEADRVVAASLPLLAEGPKYGKSFETRERIKRRYRLYNRCIPLEAARTGDRSIVILGNLHTIQTPTVAEVTSFWSILYLLGEVSLPSHDAMATEIAEFNAWVRKRYTSVGERYPYALFDWIPHVDKLLRDAGLKAHRKGNFLAEFFLPYGPDDYAGYLDEYIKKRAPVLSRRTSSSIDGKDYVETLSLMTSSKV